MLTKRQNLMETIRGGSPDRFVNPVRYDDGHHVYLHLRRDRL